MLSLHSEAMSFFRLSTSCSSTWSFSLSAFPLWMVVHLLMAWPNFSANDGMPNDFVGYVRKGLGFIAQGIPEYLILKTQDGVSYHSEHGTTLRKAKYHISAGLSTWFNSMQCGSNVRNRRFLYLLVQLTDSKKVNTRFWLFTTNSTAMLSVYKITLLLHTIFLQVNGILRVEL